MSLPLCHDTFNLEFFYCFMWSRSWSCLYVRDLTKEWSSVQEDQTGGKIADVFTCFISMGVLTLSLSSCCGKLLGLFINGCSVAPVWAWLILKWEWDYKGAQEDTVGTYSPLFGLIWQLWIVKLSSSSSLILFSSFSLAIKVHFLRCALKFSVCSIIHDVQSCSIELQMQSLCTFHSGWVRYFSLIRN